MVTASQKSRSAEEIQTIVDAVRQRFNVLQEYLKEDGSFDFYLDAIQQRDTKSSFLSLLSVLKQSGDTALLRKTEQGLILVVFPKQTFGKPKLKTPLILLLTTLAAVLADGLFRAYGYQDPLTGPLSVPNIIEIAGIYTISLIGIIGIHELGHKIASWYHGMESSWPYFIPGIPGIWPTMGAVIRAADIPVNRDALFDLGLSGPIAGLLVTVIVSILAVLSAGFIPASSVPVGQTGGLDYYTQFLFSVLRGSASSNVVVVGPIFYLLYFAYSIGFLITFINLLPAWQLDGGHVSNSAVSPRTHQILTYVSVVFMFLIQFYLMAILVLILASRTPSLRPLDDVSPLSRNRKVLFWLTWILSAAIYVAVVYNNYYFGIGTLIH